MPNTLEFQPGRRYYFISTSWPGAVGGRRGGYCANYNMKVSTCYTVRQLINCPLLVPNSNSSFSGSSSLSHTLTHSCHTLRCTFATRGFQTLLFLVWFLVPKEQNYSVLKLNVGTTRCYFPKLYL